MQFGKFRKLSSNIQQCIAKTSPPGLRCLEPLHGGFDEYDTFNSTLELYMEYLEAYDASSNTIADAPSPFSADAPSLAFSAAPSPVSGKFEAPEDETMCLYMACSPDGRVLVGGKLCDRGSTFPYCNPTSSYHSQHIHELNIDGLLILFATTCVSKRHIQGKQHSYVQAQPSFRSHSSRQNFFPF
jgi:hypothetical protein